MSFCMTIGRKVLVVGCPGSGKSTFAMRLQQCTGLPLIHLDNIWWKPDRTHISREEFDRQLAELLRQERWILDGDYSRTYEVRLRACDTVFFLDYAEAQCLDGITERIGQVRSDMPWVAHSTDPQLISQVRKYRAENRPVLLDLLAKYPDRQIFLFQNRAEADNWLAAFAASSEGGCQYDTGQQR